MRALALISLWWVASSCSCAPDTSLHLLVTADEEPLLRDFVAFIGDPRLELTTVKDPRAALAQHRFAIAVSSRGDCTECYRVDGEGERLTVSGGAPLGLQYGLSAALEAFGYRFVHPWKTRLPDGFTTVDRAGFAQEHAPQVSQRRGLHLHTLHPIEAMFDFWVPSDAHLEGAKRVVDFVVKNRGNYVQWAALDDIEKDAATRAAWAPHTRAITDAAHARGVHTGAAIQLFGMSNLQNAFDLIDDTTGDPLPELSRRLHLLLDDTGFDTVNLSFGEFFGADPAAFVQRVNDTAAALQAVQPGAELTATIHVGDSPSQHVVYMGQDQIYYFLVQYADPSIVPWVHTVMFYDLYEDAGGAYFHDTFAAHRAFLEGHLTAGQKVGYFPESAYWVAFDDCVPLWLPLYVRSRFTDLSQLRAAGQLQDQVVFSSGWEWGYWQNDVATLRMSYELPETWDRPLSHLFSAWPQGAAVGDLVRRVGEAQHDALLVQRLAPYLAGRDQLMDAGRRLGIVSQPDRVDPDAVAQLTPSERAAFVNNVLVPLEAYAAAMTALDAELEALGLPADPWLDELRDGLGVTAARARFSAALYRATVTYADTGGDGGFLARADAEFTAAQAIVKHRRRALFEPDFRAILFDGPNPTFYQYGYLREADTLCFWTRERAQARNLVLQAGEVVPGCVL